ncbi:MAG: class I adenylate-forming enzyme family protein [Pseudomonadota bacterium]
MNPNPNLGTLFPLGPEFPFIVDCRLDATSSAPIWTNRAIDEYANGVAARLRTGGYRPGDRIAVLSQNRVEFIIAYLGIMRAGLIAVPVNIKFPPETIAYVLSDCGARFAFVDDLGEQLAPSSLPRQSFDAPAFLEPNTHYQATAHDADDVAMFLYTSGSTGKPKGVPLTHHGHRWVIQRRLRPDIDYASERLLVAAPLYHMNALAIVKFAAAAGASVVLLPQFTAPAYINAIENHRCTWLTSVPTMLALVAQERALLAKTDLSSVTSVRMGSAPVTARLLAQVREAFPSAQVQIGYGTTESGPVAFGPHPDGYPTPDLSLGFPDREVDVRLADSSGEGNPAHGVLEIRCPAVTPGYHELPEKTARAMTEDGYYRTGDVMRQDDQGFYYFVGRDDDMFVCNGENVFPEEVERRLEGHPDILQACVVPVDDEVRGQMPVAFVVAKSPGTLDEEAVKQFAINNGPAYQHPRHVLFREALPLAGTNKYDRHFLSELAEQHVHERQAP